MNFHFNAYMKNNLERCVISFFWYKLPAKLQINSIFHYYHQEAICSKHICFKKISNIIFEISCTKAALYFLLQEETTFSRTFFFAKNIFFIWMLPYFNSSTFFQKKKSTIFDNKIWLRIHNQYSFTLLVEYDFSKHKTIFVSISEDS